MQTEETGTSSSATAGHSQRRSSSHGSTFDFGLDSLRRCDGDALPIAAVCSPDDKSCLLETAPAADSTAVYFVTFVGAIGGLLFGYDTGVISGALLPIRKHFDLSDAAQELVVSITVAGAILGASGAGWLSNNVRFDRLRT